MKEIGQVPDASLEPEPHLGTLQMIAEALEDPEDLTKKITS